MRRHAYCESVEPTRNGRADHPPAVVYHSQGTRQESFGKELCIFRYIIYKLGYVVVLVHMHNQRIVRGATLCCINELYRVVVEGVCTQPVDRLSGESNKPSLVNY